MEADGFSRWGFAIYRCTYESGAESNAFMARLYNSVTELLDLDNGLDILDSYAPTVLQDPSFAGATTATLRAHFRKTWTPAAFIDENPEVLESVLQAPGDGMNLTGYVRLVYAEWEPQDEEDKLVPLEGSTTKDVGWMNVLYNDAQLIAYLNIQRDWDWEGYYERPPAILAIE
ncbi:uncharacterized protein BDW70DRAFT_150214 [Aspergillus foveolatus]|uniref:uncharacterized protein n=1 Tax=Aspergillus foveolatus TaxID=210207 RepID=UPI003CCE34B0